MPKKKSTNAKIKPRSAQQFNTVRSHDYRVIYGNNLKVTTSPTEVRLTFAHFTDDVGLGSFINEEEICVCINPGLMRMMMIQIEAALQNHEKLWEQIELPKGLTMPDFNAMYNGEPKEKK